MGTEPNPKEMPPAFEDFIEDIQLCFIISYKLNDIWDTFNGAYLGKDFNGLKNLFDIYEIPRDIRVLYSDIIKNINNISSEIINNKLNQQRKKSQKQKTIDSRNIGSG